MVSRYHAQEEFVFRFASNAAYVIGSFAETEVGAERILSITKRKKSSSIIEVRKNFLLVSYL